MCNAVPVRIWLVPLLVTSPVMTKMPPASAVTTPSLRTLPTMVPNPVRNAPGQMCRLATSVPPERWRVAPGMTCTPLTPVSVIEPLKSRIPARNVVPPLKLWLPVMVSVPVPDLSSAIEPTHDPGPPKV